MAARHRSRRLATTGPVVLNFSTTKSRADHVDAPLAAVGLWQQYIDANPNAPDLADAKAELEKWKALDKDHAEKINGKWVGGEERQKLLEKVAQLLKDADEMGQNNQTVKAVAKLEEAVRIYPNSFNANFELGYVCLSKATASGSERAARPGDQVAGNGDQAPPKLRCGMVEPRDCLQLPAEI